MTNTIAITTPSPTKLTDSTEIIYRQITKHHLKHNGEAIGSHAFGSTTDRGRPSFAQASKTKAQDARDWHIANVPSGSVAVCRVSVDEVNGAGLNVMDDSHMPVPEGKKRAPAHCYVDYSGCDRTELKSARAHLMWAAKARGIVHTNPVHVVELSFTL